MNIAVTGVSSYLGRSILPLLHADSRIESITGADLRAPGPEFTKVKFVQRDVRDPELYRDFQGCDTLLHMAFVVMPIKDAAMALDININGSINAFEAAARCGMRKIVYSSSVASYGAWPDNPPVTTEEVPVRGMPDFYYSYTKAEVEKHLDRFQEKHPEMIITRFRPCIFIGPSIDNLVRRIITTWVMVKPTGRSALMQFVWDQDVAAAFHTALMEDHPGAFNLAGDNPIDIDELLDILQKPAIPLPFPLVKFATQVGHRLGIGRGDYAGWIDTTEYPIIVSCEKAKKVLHWNPKYDTPGAIKKLNEYKPELKEQAEKDKNQKTLADYLKK